MIFIHSQIHYPTSLKLRLRMLQPYLRNIFSSELFQKNAALKWQPGQFFKLQNYEVNTKNSDSDLNYIEPVFLSPNMVNTESGIIEFIINTAGFPALMLKSFQPGDNIFLTGPSGTKTFIPEKERVMLAAEESGNSYMLPVLKALKRKGNYVIFFSRFKKS